MANAVAIYTAEPTPYARSRTGAPVIELNAYRTRGEGLRNTYEIGDDSAQTENVGEYESYRRGRRSTGGSLFDQFLSEAGKRRASAALSFAAQQIAQENLSPGAHYEPYRPAMAAYNAAAMRGTPADLPRGQALTLFA